jgi:hypothetical protein
MVGTRQKAPFTALVAAPWRSEDEGARTDACPDAHRLQQIGVGEPTREQAAKPADAAAGGRSAQRTQAPAAELVGESRSMTLMVSPKSVLS